MISSALKVQMVRHFRLEDMSIKQIAEKYGYPEASVDKVIFPNGRGKAPTFSYKELTKNVKDKESLKKLTDNMSSYVKKKRHSEGKKGLLKSEKDPKMVNAGKKAWETRRSNQLSSPGKKNSKKAAKIILGVAIVKLNEALTLLK